MPKPSLSVVMPAYNEEKLLELSFRKTVETLTIAGFDFEIVIVNDGSHDRTDEIARTLSAGAPNVKYICHEKNQGIGAGFRSGVVQATKNYVILVPSDNPLLPEDMASFLPHIGKFDIIAGARVERTGYPLSLKFLSFVYNRFFIPLLFQIPLTDVNWIQMYRRDIFVPEGGGIKIEYSGIIFFVEILAKARRKGMSMVEVPVRMRKRIHGRPTISRLPVITAIFCDMLKLFLRIRFSRN